MDKNQELPSPNQNQDQLTADELIAVTLHDLASQPQSSASSEPEASTNQTKQPAIPAWFRDAWRDI